MMKLVGVREGEPSPHGCVLVVWASQKDGGVYLPAQMALVHLSSRVYADANALRQAKLGVDRWGAKKVTSEIIDVCRAEVTPPPHWWLASRVFSLGGMAIHFLVPDPLCPLRFCVLTTFFTTYPLKPIPPSATLRLDYVWPVFKPCTSNPVHANRYPPSDDTAP